MFSHRQIFSMLILSHPFHSLNEIQIMISFIWWRVMTWGWGFNIYATNIKSRDILACISLEFPIHFFHQFPTATSFHLFSNFSMLKHHRFEISKRGEGEQKVYYSPLVYEEKSYPIARSIRSKATKAIALFLQDYLGRIPDSSQRKGLQGASTLGALRSRSASSPYG